MNARLAAAAASRSLLPLPRRVRGHDDRLVGDARGLAQVDDLGGRLLQAEPPQDAAEVDEGRVPAAPG